MIEDLRLTILDLRGFANANPATGVCALQFFISLNPINLRYPCSIVNFCKFAIIFKIPNNANSKRKYK